MVGLFVNVHGLLKLQLLCRVSESLPFWDEAGEKGPRHQASVAGRRSHGPNNCGRFPHTLIMMPSKYFLEPAP